MQTWRTVQSSVAAMINKFHKVPPEAIRRHRSLKRSRIDQITHHAEHNFHHHSHQISAIRIWICLENSHTITEEEFFCALSGNKRITTSQPSPGDVMDLWDQILAEGYEELVYIPMSSGLSNSCAAAIGYSQDYDGKVEVVDNHRISVTMYESVLHAREMSLNGASAKEIKAALESDAYNSSIYITVNTLEYLKKGGRITPAAALIGTVLSIKPILTIQGEKLDSFAKARGSMKRAEEKMILAIQSDLEKRFSHQDMSKLHIGAAGAGLTPEQQEEWLTLLHNKFPEADVFYSPLSASISVHTGPGAVGIGISFR